MTDTSPTEPLDLTRLEVGDTVTIVCWPASHETYTFTMTDKFKECPIGVLVNEGPNSYSYLVVLYGMTDRAPGRGYMGPTIPGTLSTHGWLVLETREDKDEDNMTIMLRPDSYSVSR